MRIFFKDTLLISSLIVGYTMLETILTFNFDDLFKALVFNLIVYLLPMYLVYIFCTRAIKSEKLLFIASLVLAMLPTLVQILANNNPAYTHTVDGRALFADGKITLYGFLLTTATPLLMLPVYALHKIITPRKGA